ncbi:MAG: DUF2279 domain-containing protein [Spirochaetes bacterium]|nr:DUF2279 domain-containing protein [Spirochaetota bacterium]
MKCLNILLILFFILSSFSFSYSQENVELPGSQGDLLQETIKLPVNLYDDFTFSEKNAPYARNIMYVSAPGFMLLYGVYLWDWDISKQEDFTIKAQTFKGSHAINGAADKWGHMYANYVGMRLFTFLFRATGSSRNRAIIEGAILTDLTSLIGEIGDGFSPNYGFDPYDVLFNQFGIILGAILELSPTLDRIFAMKWEYFPGPRVRNHLDKTDRWDVSTDYNDSKYILTTKLGGIPYLSLTPLRYFNVDLGYFSRGYRHTEEYSSRARNIFVGVSVNFTIAFGDLLPVGYTSSTMQSVFNYYHPPCDLEVKKWVLSDLPHSEFSDE